MFVLVVQIQMEHDRQSNSFQIRKLVSRFVFNVNALDKWFNF